LKEAMLQKTAVAVAVLAATAFAAPAHAAVDDLTLVSGAFGGPPLAPNQASDSPKLSADGRYVAFSSSATNLVAGDGNGVRDVFRRDTQTGETLLVSRADGPGGAPGTSASGDGDDRIAISADGRFIAFGSEADNLIVGDDDSVANAYVRDVSDGRTYLASRNDADAAAVGGNSGWDVDISLDGRYVVFATDATNMPGTALGEQIVRRDIVAEATTLVSGTPGGAAGNGNSSGPRISDDGTRVAFATGAVNLGAAGSDRVVVRDLAANTLVIASRLDGVAGDPQTSYTARISADGSKAGWSTGHADRFYVRDLATGKTVEASIAPDGGRIPGFCCYDFELSGDGRHVASYAGGEAADSTDYLVYHRDTVAGVTRVVSRPSGPDTAPTPSRFSQGVAISDSGRFVAFGSTSVAFSDADYRGPTPGQNDSDVFLRDVLGPPPPVVQPERQAEPDRTAPAVTGVSVAPKRFRVANAPTAIVAAKRQGAKRRAKPRPAPRGTAIRFTLSEAATARIAISRKLPGLRAKRRGRTACVTPTKRNRAAARESIAKRPAIAKLEGAERRKAIANAERKLRCTRYEASGVLTRRDLAAGERSVPFSGRIGSKALKPGGYRIQVGATDAAGNRSSRRAETSFLVVR
jgi:hypothetical protein